MVVVEAEGVENGGEVEEEDAAAAAAASRFEAVVINAWTFAARGERLCCPDEIPSDTGT